MTPRQVIELKRDGRELAPEHIHAFIEGYARRQVSDAHMASLAMVVCFRGLSLDETTAMADALARSGECLTFTDLDRPVVGMQTTGETGDPAPLALAPLGAACGICVPMLCGRLSGTGCGMLEKLEAIPGFSAGLSPARFRRITAGVGCAFAAPSARLVPADRKLAALSAACGTASSPSLIAASLMAKVFAGGARAAVLDVKCGRGARTGTLPDARNLARSLLTIGRRMGWRMSAVISRMNVPLGGALGHALELAQAIRLLQGNGPADLRELVLSLGSEMLALGGLEHDRLAALRRLTLALEKGEALDRFRRMVEAQQGDPRVIDAPERLPSASVILDVPASRAGYVSAVDVPRLARICRQLGAGMSRTADGVDPATGIDRLLKPGQPVSLHQPLMRLHGASRLTAETMLTSAVQAVQITDGPPATPTGVIETLPEPDTTRES